MRRLRYASVIPPVRTGMPLLVRVGLWLVGTTGALAITWDILRPAGCSRRPEPTQCGSNLRLIGASAGQYATAHNGAYPPTLSALFAWDPGLSPATACCPYHHHVPPASPAPAWFDNGDYVYVGAGLTATTPNATDVVVAYVRNVPEPFTGWTQVLYGDGHAENIPTTALAGELAKSKAFIAKQPPGKRS